MTARVEVALAAGAELGEGPVWDPRDDRLLWVDCERGGLHRFDPATGRDAVVATVAQPGAIAWRQAGGYVVAGGAGFLCVDAGGTVTTLADVVQGGAAVRMNDGACDVRGRFWAGTATADRRPGAALFHLDADGTVTRAVAGVGLSNGIGWSPDDRRMYYVDSATQGLDVFAFDADNGCVRARRRLVEVPAGLGIPDGLAVDADGCVWLALWGPGLVQRYTPRGALDRSVRLPTGNTTSCTFGGPALDVLFVTSARAGLDVAQRAGQPHAGAVFAVSPGVAGLPAAGYAG